MRQPVQCVLVDEARNPTHRLPSAKTHPGLQAQPLA
jgi:hypothetical protein